MQPKTLLQLFGAVAISTLLVAPVLYSINKRMPPRVAVIDLQALIAEEEERFVASAKTNTLDQAKAAAADRVAKFTKAIASAVDSTAAECGCILLNRAAIVSDSNGAVEDLTPRIRQRIAEHVEK